MRPAKYLIAAILFVAACTNTNNTNTTYNAGEIGQSADVTEGRIVSMRAVKIESDNTVGTVGGAVAGGALGSQIGGNNAVGVAGAVGGAILGGILGNQIEGGIRNDEAIEFIIKKKNGKSISIVQTNEEGFRVGDKVLVIDSSMNRGGSVKLARDLD